MKRKKILPFLLIAILGLSASCSSNSTKSDSKDSIESNVQVDKNNILTGEMAVIVDEAEFPIMREQLDVFKSSYTNANVKLIALPEREAINSLLEGNAAMIILARELTKEENAGFNQRNISPRVFPVWHDGVVFVNNISSADTSINVQTLSSLLKGNDSGKSLVLDNINSSIVRRVKEFTNVNEISSKSVKALKSSSDVLKFLETNTEGIGVLSYGQYLDYRRQFGEENKIRILSLQFTDAKGNTVYSKPSQTTFATDEYPLKTTFYVLNYQPNMGLGIGFSAFLTGDRGQRVVLKSGLLPVTMPGREIIIRDNIN
ncbi:PstS family phosphate ABC transporter substrate-binding protein [Sphingobacterium kyonggiense]